MFGYPSVTHIFLVAFQVFILLQHGTIPAIADNNSYRHFETLDHRGRYRLEWLVDWEHERVIFNVTVATRGYVAFGLSRREKMSGADIVIGGVAPNGRPYFTDRHAIGDQQPIVDLQQDWILHTAWESSTHTFLSFSRPFDTCDEYDIPINDDAVALLWAYGERDDTIEYHYENRGSKFTYLRDPDLTPREVLEATRNNHARRIHLDSGVHRWTIREIFKIPPKQTTYWCNIKKFTPPTPGKHHIIGFTVQINQEAIENMHHMLMYRCTPPLQINPTVVYEPFVKHPGEECYTPSEPLGIIPFQYCSELKIGHAIGGLPFFLPEHTGFPIGETNPSEYFLLQTHYDNSAERVNITSDIQIDIYYTRNLRRNDAGILSLGQHIPGSPSILLPPKSIDHRIYGHCSSACTKKILPAQGIKFIGALLHSHNAGRRLRVQHFRNNRELPFVSNDDNYQFSFQPIRLFRNEVTVFPGDQVTMRCYYDTTLANKTTVGGYATDQEMCKTFLVYYNRLEEYPVCRSEIVSRDYMARYLGGTRNVTWDQSRLEFMATIPPHLAGMTISEISDSPYVNWNIALRAKLQRDHVMHPQVEICPSVKEAMITSVLGLELPPNYVSYPIQASPYEQHQKCSFYGR